MDKLRIDYEKTHKDKFNKTTLTMAKFLFTKGHIVSEETRRKISLANRGKSCPTKGMKMPHTPETIAKLAIINKELGLKRRGGIYKNCSICAKEFYAQPCHKNKKYCSQKCFAKVPKIWIIGNTWNKGKHFKRNNALEIWRKNGGQPWNKGKSMPRGEKAYHWKGGRVFTTDGYWEVYSPNHPYKNRFNKVREHRLVIEKHLGRYLEPWEVVHHKNRNRADNRLENLELLSEYDHSLLHRDERWIATKLWHKNKEYCEKVNKIKIKKEIG